MCNKVLLCQEESFVRSTSVSCRAVSSGIEGNRETTSKETEISSGSTWMFFTFFKKALTFLTAWDKVSISSLRISATYLGFVVGRKTRYTEEQLVGEEYCIVYEFSDVQPIN